MDQHPNKRPAQRSRASLIVLIMLAFLLMIAAGVLVASMPDDQAGQQTTTEATAGTPDDSGFSCAASEAQQIYPFSSGVMKMTGTRAAYLDIHGAELYSVDVAFSNPFCVSNGSFFLAADRDGHSLVMLDSKGERFRAAVEGRISGAAIREDGYLAVVQDQSDSTGVVTIFAPGSGGKLFDVIFAESGYVLSVSFPSGQDSFDVTLVNTASSDAAPVIKRYSLAGKQISEIKPGLTGIYPLTAYDAEGQLVLCGAADLAALSYTSDTIIWQKTFNQVAAVRTTDAGLAVLATDEQDGLCSLFLLGSDGQARTTTKIGDNVTNIDIRGSMALMGCGTRVIAAGLETGVIALDQNVAAEVIRVGFASDGSLTVVTRSGVMRLNQPSP